MLGFEPAADADAAAAHPDLPAVNARLRDDAYGAMHALVDDWIVVRVEDTLGAGVAPGGGETGEARGAADVDGRRGG